MEIEKEKIYYKFNVYPSHSVSFFVKRSVQNKIGLYDERLNFCSDYDFFFKLFNHNKMIGSNTKKNEIIGFFRSGGISEKISKLSKILTEFKIRFKNGQNIFFLFILLILTFLNEIKNFAFKK